LAGGEREPVVYKQLREPRALGEVEDVVRFPSCLEAGFASRLRSSAAWPLAAVVGADRSVALGTLMARAPSSFWARHRDGQLRLATLSYLATDPDRIAVAYGVQVPAPGSPERVALVYALCRLVEAWEGPPEGLSAAHGDLSAKNILWSFQPVPGVFVLDCDGAVVWRQLDRRCKGPQQAARPRETAGLLERTAPQAAEALEGVAGPEAAEASADHQERTAPEVAVGPRATTPNWYDPAGPSGAGRREADRYALGLAFLRVVGAANFPIQGRQRSGGIVSVDLDLPRRWARLPDLPWLWELCERSLSCLDPASRPSPGEWAGHLEQLLDLLGRADLAGAVRAAQGDPYPSRQAAGAAARPAVTVGDVAVRPVLRERAVSTWQLIRAAPSGGGEGSLAGAPPLELLRHIARGWASAHRLAIGLLCARGRRSHGARRLAGVLVLDLAAACVVLFVVGMIVSPWIGL
jgi:hypothetical protein